MTRLVARHIADRVCDVMGLLFGLYTTVPCSACGRRFIVHPLPAHHLCRSCAAMRGT